MAIVCLYLIIKECEDLKAKRNNVATLAKKAFENKHKQALLEEGKNVKEKLSILEKRALQLQVRLCAHLCTQMRSSCINNAHE